MLVSSQYITLRKLIGNFYGIKNRSIFQTRFTSVYPRFFKKNTYFFGLVKATMTSVDTSNAKTLSSSLRTASGDNVDVFSTW